MGPEVEYATQKTNKVIELRIYPGADGRFTFYEDENDNYNYEKGQYANFTFAWNDKQKELSISGTKGNFPGMLKQHTFNIIMVHGKHGSSSIATTNADETVKYNGKAMVVRLR
ncbi:DUF5110 domain-containing protein [Mucilaginibacter sp. OK098]|uniref:DUF5110 domain-containing protein n=1 Tax=Mucilaginibacter sp. OK098 TaxID=1855297 RepID=UPI001F34216C|nr:DUF5110 domain-containing protein [Mucilaginibacter sp. OK098]